MVKILNLYAGVGGNRRLWEGHDITSVEYDPDIAAAYRSLYPDDELIVGDAHSFLLDNYSDYDFIWSSPPCQSHSRVRYHSRVLSGRSEMIYPDMRLYEEILLLKHNFRGRYVVENVVPWYAPMMNPVKLHRHLYWANFTLPNEREREPDGLRHKQTTDLQRDYGIDLSGFYLKNRRQVLRNMVHPQDGLDILNAALV